MKKVICVSAFIFSLVVLFFGCTKNDNDDMQNGLEAKLTLSLNVLHDATTVYNTEFKQSGDSIAAFDSMRTWLANHPDVKGGWFHNREFLEIEFKNGLKSPINIIPVSNNGEHLRRGGGGAYSLNAFISGVETQEIKNNKVLVLIPYPEEFLYSSTDIQDIMDSFHAGNLEMEVDVVVGSNVKLSDLDRLGDYGFIIFNVHGVKYGLFLTYINEVYDNTDIWFPEEVIEATFNVLSIPPDKISNGQIEIGLHIFNKSNGEVNFRFSVLVTEDYIRQLNIDLSDAVIFGNHCYSAHTADGLSENNLPQAWRSKGVATYYGYAKDNGRSLPVDNEFCKDMELLLINGLVVDGDTTGAAHLKPDGTSPFYDTEKAYFPTRAALLTQSGPLPPGPPLYLVQFFDMNYSYEVCDADLVDSRDGQVYKTVCIGDQVWMAENLNYNIGTNWCYDNIPDSCEQYGRLYDWQTAQIACPPGWHLPTEAEWLELADTLGGESLAGGKMKSLTSWNAPNTGATNSSNFSALASGSFSSDPSTYGFQYLGERAVFWSSTPWALYPVFATTFQLTRSFGVLLKSGGNGTYGFSCRCVKD